MCGIAGIVSRLGIGPNIQRVAQRCIASLKHRGPDGHGFWSDEMVLLAHTRLAIVDPKSGNQPMTNEGGGIVVTFNGEIYNSPQLRNYLMGKGHVFRTRTDTEVLVHLYEEHGVNMLRELRGMFAFAIWDRPRRRLLLARDRLGIKPFYYKLGKNEIVFASQPAGIFASGRTPSDCDIESLPAFLFYGCFVPWRCFYRDVLKLAPGHFLLLDVDSWSVRSERYWEVPEGTRNLACCDAVSQLSVRIGDAVRPHLMADVPVGIALSGGLDSSVVAYHASDVSREPLIAFTVNWCSFDRQDGEFERARATANRFGLVHRNVPFSEKVESGLKRLVGTMDEPLGDTSTLPLYALCLEARSYVKILLTGDGGDEVFAGYRRYRTDRLERILGRNLKRVFEAMRQLTAFQALYAWSGNGIRKLVQAVERLSLDDGLGYALSLGQAPLQIVNSWLQEDIRPMLWQDLLRLAAIWHDCPSRHPVQRMAYVDMNFLLPEAFLVKADRTSMAVGLEIRPPLLDHVLLEWAWTIPPQHKLGYWTTKLLMRRAYRNVLPREVIIAAKQGFELRGLSEQVRQVVPTLLEYLHALEIWKRTFILDAVIETINRFVAGRTEYAQLLWNLYCLLHWYDHWIQRKRRLHREER